jgi:hypothetical protein
LCADGGAVVEEVLGKVDLGHGRALGELGDGALDLLLLPGGHGGAATRGARTRAIRCTTPRARMMASVSKRVPRTASSQAL